jgi:hypothetical protein
MDSAEITMVTVRTVTVGTTDTTDITILTTIMAAILMWFMVPQRRIKSRQETRGIGGQAMVVMADLQDGRHPQWD